MLSEKPAYFSYEEKGWYFDLRFEGTADLDDGLQSSGKYLLALNFCRVENLPSVTYKPPLSRSTSLIVDTYKYKKSIH